MIFSLLLFLYSNSFAQSYILNDDNLLDERVKNKILEIGDEVKLKLGVNVYIYTKGSLGVDPQMPTKEKIEYIKLYEENIL